MNEQKIEEIKNALREVAQLLAQRGKPLSPELKLALAKVIEHAANRIQQLRQESEERVEEPSETPVNPQTPEIQPSMPSSNVYGFNFDEDTGKLFVKFQGNGGYGEGPVYSYEGVPKVIFELFKRGSVPARTDGQNKWGKWWKGKTPSLGASLYTLIKSGGYPYQRLA